MLYSAKSLPATDLDFSGTPNDVLLDVVLIGTPVVVIGAGKAAAR